MKIKLLTCFFLLIFSISFASKNANSNVENTVITKEKTLMSEVIIDNMAISESDGTIIVPIHIDVPDSVDIVLNITTADGTAISPNDYTSVTTSVTIPAGQTSSQITIYIVDDSISGEFNENFTVNATVISGNTTNSNASGTIIIIDQDDSAIVVGDVTVNESEGTVSVPVSISGLSALNSVISITTIDNFAVNSDDYTTTTATVTIPALQSTVYVSVPIVDDNIGEGTENFIVRGIVTSGFVLGNESEGTVTIIDDDLPIISISDVTVNEIDGTAVVPITISNPSDVDTAISVTTTDGTATNPMDYTMTSLNATIPAGQTTTNMFIPITDDTITEPTEIINIQGTVTSGNTSNSSANGIVTIIDQDDSFFSIGDVTIAEDDGTASVSVNIDSPSSVNTKIAITTVDNSATSPDDYTTITVTATIPAGQTSVNVSIPITDDTIGEPTEDFTVSGTVTTGNTGNATDSGTVTILDNDTPTMTIDDASVNEDVGNATIAVNISNPSSVDTVISISLQDDGATNQNDYISTVSTVTIPAGQTSVNLSIPIVDDSEDEDNESFFVYGVVQTGNTLNPNDFGIVTIIDNDFMCSITDPTQDCDGDGVTNGDEQNPPSGEIATDPDNPCDFNELDITLAQSGDYLLSDCDGDGVANGQEIYPQFDGTTTDPNDACSFNINSIYTFSTMSASFWMGDCDGDGVTNGQELDPNGNGFIDQNTTDPLNPCDPSQNVGYTGYDEENVIWQAADCDDDNQANALELILGSDPYDPNFNTIEGTVMFDSDADGCDANDAVFSYTKINIGDGINTTAVFTNELGEYSYYAGTGAYLITPDLENPTFFTVTPEIAITNFPSINNSVFNQDFCITSNGVNPDIEIVIAPIGAARPGFNARYKVTYVNKGNQTVSGVVDFMYDDAVLDYVSSTQMPTTQSTGVLSWNYTDLAPFESNSFNITLNVNSPMETPPINNGDQLAFSATINPIAGDILPDDNQSSFTQTVVGSYDPNDITCVEGNNVDPNEIGEYLHYIINFENTGTFFAENIVVEMDIDPTQFDINTLRLLSSSHAARVTIVGTTVRFIFQNIFLPVDGQGNILIKMKTQNTLVENDMVSNDARIFFDFNFPIQTNIANTTFAILSNQEFSIDTSIVLYPNPTKDNIYIEGNSSIKTIEIYDMQGRMLMQESYNSKNVNLNMSTQTAGIYFVKIKTENGIKTEKIVKM